MTLTSRLDHSGVGILAELNGPIELRQRKSIRLPDYDYRSHGAYFLTIVTHHRKQLFGRISAGIASLSQFGVIVHEEWQRAADLRQNVELDEFIVMPNHVHGIIWLKRDAVGAQRAAPLRSVGGVTSGVQAGSLGAIVRAFKAASTKRINALRGAPGEPVWQRNYWERILRVDRELDRAREYIRFNALNWPDDPQNPGPRASV